MQGIPHEIGIQGFTSMGPRLIGRGNSEAEPPANRSASDFNGAASHRTRKLEIGDTVYVDSDDTSMGPRLIGRGNKRARL